MKTKITSKFQTTIPKKIREQLHISVADALDWTIEDEKIVLRPVNNNFLSFRNSVEVGAGDIDKDIAKARKLRSERFK